MYICNNCGRVKPNLSVREENRGEYWGDECREMYYDSECLCGGYFEQAKICKKCGKYFYDDDNDFCADCRENIINRFYQMTCEFTAAEMNLIFDRRI